ncbi:hypothetical protein AO727_13635 [Acinetobacter baumannii]|uniref:hypothetical protein n=1 Tax=Acinetobacter baumannii TaxID=470 RepID=UPI0002AEC1C6|nr:hypothetical protein [Acinetobacter baumannii]ELX07491.1 hypothetical protein ACINNAV57_0593 [Acinetobacter baumannii Naval-57]KRW19971.1 hypothetical protein AO727_13635 [Acinetobacter baumannii]MCF4554384.1 hypothetical protein [Acinetobacter baumannii]MCF4586707.1 hypothetical protein [Acinetobacter baumannii]MCF4624349.1 hypothetical protein [Acinetobacter baumannii]
MTTDQSNDSLDDLDKYIDLINQLEEHIIKRYKYPYGLPSAYAEYIKSYLPEQAEIISEEITESDRQWFYEQLDQGLLNESPERQEQREQIWKSPLLKGTNDQDILIPEEDLYPRHYSEVATQIRNFKTVLSTENYPDQHKKAKKYFKLAFRLYSKHYDSSFYWYTLPKDIQEQIHNSKQAKNKHKDFQKLKRIYFSLVKCLIDGNVLNTYSYMDFLIIDLNGRLIPYILEYLIHRNWYEKLLYRTKFDEVTQFLSRLRGPAAKKKKHSPIIYSSFAGYSQETLEKAREQYRERRRKANLDFKKYLNLYNLYLQTYDNKKGTATRISPETEEALNILANSETWLKKDRPDLYQYLKSLIKQ